MHRLIRTPDDANLGNVFHQLQVAPSERDAQRARCGPWICTGSIEIVVVKRLQHCRPISGQRLNARDRCGRAARPEHAFTTWDYFTVNGSGERRPPPDEMPSEPGDARCRRRMRLFVGPIRPPGAVGAGRDRPRVRRRFPQTHLVGKGGQMMCRQALGEIELPAQRFKLFCRAHAAALASSAM